MSKKKKQLITIIVLLVVLAASGIGYTMLSKHQADKEKQDAADAQDTQEIKLYSMKAEEITQIRFINSNQDMTLVKKDGVWKDSADPDFPVNQEYVESMIDETGELTASQLVVENPEDLSQYELDQPPYSVEITNQSGEIKKLVIGMESIAAGGCYAYVDQADKIYVIASNITDYLDYTHGEMMEVPEAPDITAEYVTGYDLTSAKGKSFAAKYHETKAEYADVDGWDITRAYGITMPGSKDSLQTLFGGLTNMKSSEGVAYHATPELLKQYGLSDPAYILDVDYYTVEEEDTEDLSEEDTENKEQTKTDHHYQISIGAKNDQEDQYYVSVDGVDGIYLMSAETIDALVEINAFDYVSRPLHTPTMETLQSIEFTYQGQKHEIKVTKKEVENGISEDGSPVYDYTIMSDGKEIGEQEFQSAYSSIFGNLIYSKEIDNKIKGKGQKAQADMTVVTDQRKVTFRFLPYDGNNFYRVEQDGKCYLLVDINVVENAMEQLLAMKTVEDDAEQSSKE